MNIIDYNEIIELLNQEDLTKSNKNKSKNFILINDQLHFKRNHRNLLVVQEGQVEKLIEKFHNNPLAGHFEFRKTYEEILKRFYWPGMKKKIEKWI